MNRKCYFLIPAAGSGTRMGAGQPKLMRNVEGRPVILRTLGAVADVCRCNYADMDYKIVMVTTNDLIGILQAMCAEYFPDLNIIFTLGGNTRTESVSKGLNMINDADDDDDTKGGTKKAEARIRKLVDEKNALKKRNAELEKLSGDDGKAILAAAERSGILPGLMTKAEAEAFEDIETLPRVIERYEDWLDDHGTDDEFELGGNKTMTYGEVKKRVRRLRSQLEDLKDKYGERRKALMEKVRKIYETGVAALEAGWTPGKKTAKKGERTKPKGKEDRPGGKSPSQLPKHAAKRPEDFEVDDEDDLDAFIAAENRREKKRRN